ncbi:hypothetical protein NHX12_031842 [Muraenolepis orangiensis]|uniref:BHLH domain-containing protein n=1 Tax=Muraenolepis orangiensis TaxID=630683 RepID=A0A9Q0IK23_9TELE|nr:hypothetical protein NHX12_031842 [Muraenolepis orangiensis]
MSASSARKRIRTCCNELNSLVPFCKPETDKSTTLLWTTVFLKHLQELYGDSLKEYQYYIVDVVIGELETRKPP